MLITYIKKWLKCENGSDDNLYVGYNYYRLSEAYRTADGKLRNRTVMGLGELEDFSKPERKELGELLTAMIDRGELPLTSSSKVYDRALAYYQKYKDEKQAERKMAEAKEKLKKEAEARAERERRESVLVKLSSFRQKTAEPLVLKTSVWTQPAFWASTLFFVLTVSIVSRPTSQFFRL